ncbi:MAG: hypothetical protein EAX96_05930 [Candidatus Lokiarchaeota archaeon]|nr:hypothetical protein [Candidatus Lokiarchaeota archaeon]
MNKPYFLYILSTSGICLFSYNFRKNIEKFQEQLFSGFIAAISKFTQELNSQLGYAEKEEKLASIPIGDNFEILLTHKKKYIGALISERKDIDEDMKKFNEDLINGFINKYKKELENWDGDIVKFEGYEIDIKTLFRKMTIFSFQIPKLKDTYEQKKDELKEYSNLIELIDGKRAIDEISRALEKSYEEVKQIIATLLWNGVIELSEKVYAEDIFEPKRDLFYLIRAKDLNLEKEELKSHLKKDPRLEHLAELYDFDSFFLARKYDLLKAIDGFKTVYDLSKEFKNLNINDIKYLISYYLSEGSYLEKVDLYPQIIEISDKLREKLPPESLALSYSLENICDGEVSLLEISEKIGVSIMEIKKVLDILEKNVTYVKKYRK